MGALIERRHRWTERCNNIPHACFKTTPKGKLNTASPNVPKNITRHDVLSTPTGSLRCRYVVARLLTPPVQQRREPGPVADRHFLSEGRHGDSVPSDTPRDRVVGGAVCTRGVCVVQLGHDGYRPGDRPGKNMTGGQQIEDACEKSVHNVSTPLSSTLLCTAVSRDLFASGRLCFILRHQRGSNFRASAPH